MLISQASHCALIIVIELAMHHQSKGITLEQIAESHHIPVQYLTPAAEQLCSAGIITCESLSNHAKCLFLTRDPRDIFAFEIVQIFDSDVFTGKFLDESTGRWFLESKAAKQINYQRKQYIQHLRSKLRKINIKSWCDILERMSSDPIY